MTIHSIASPLFIASLHLLIMLLLLVSPAESPAFSRSIPNSQQQQQSQRTRAISDASIVTNRANDDNIHNHDSMIMSRRDVWNRMTSTCVGASLVSAVVVMTGKPLPGRAACLYGDTSPDCIGVYKVHIDDEFMPFMDTPEKLKAFAPDVRWVKPTESPKNYQDAVKLIKEMRDKCESLNDIVLKGELEEAGVNLLDIIPKVTVSGRVILATLQEVAQEQQQQLQLQGTEDTLQKSVVAKAHDRPRRPLENMSMKSYRAESAHTSLLATLGQCDVLIGQARAGQLGALTLAQIHILADIREALEHFDDMLRSLPETI